MCPYDSLFDYLVSTYSVTETGFLYPSVNHIESRVNTALKGCHQHWVEDDSDDKPGTFPETSSHTFRRSSIMQASSHSHVPESIIQQHAGLVS